MTGASPPCLSSDSALISSRSSSTSTSSAPATRHLLHRLGGHLERARAAHETRATAARRRRFGQRVIARDGVGDRRLRRHDRLDVVARHELDVVHGEHVGRIGHRDRERRARSAERNDLIFLRGLGRDQLDDGRIDLELRQVDRRDAVLLAEERRELFVLDEPELDQIEAELPPIGLLIVQGLLELIRSDALLF